MAGLGLGFGGALAPLGLPAVGGATNVAYHGELSDTVGAALVQIVGLATPLSDTFRASYLIDAVRAQPADASDVINMSPSLGFVWGVLMLEQLRIQFGQATNHHFQLSLAQGVGVDDAQVVAFPSVIAEGVGIALAETIQTAILVAEQLNIVPVVAPMFKLGQSVSETISIADALARFLGGDVVETIGMAPVLAGVASMPDTISETVSVVESATPVLILRVTAAETIGIDDAQALQMLFKPTIAEGIELAAAYLSPGAGVATWVMNTRTGAVTEYSNYAFNSFAQLGHKYIGASSAGLYELVGNDDDGTSIVAKIKSGFAQWAGSRFTMFKGIYLGVRGEGNFVLRLITGDGKTYDYAVATRDQRTTKVHLGKGLRARYFAFELISTGQDFDLDTIEFVPLVADRRV